MKGTLSVDKIKGVMKEKKITQPVLAKKMGMNLNTLKSKLSNHRTISGDDLGLIAICLGKEKEIHIFFD